MIKNQHSTDLSTAETKIVEKKIWVIPSVEIISGADIAAGTTTGGNEGQHTFLYNTFHGRYHS